MQATIDTIIFDLGAVLIDWNPRYLYRSFFTEEKQVDWFLENICTGDWNENQDAGYPVQSATEELIEKFPEWKEEISAYYGRWTEMLGGPISETVDVFKRLKQDKDLRFYALTNWSAETFPIALERYDFLQWFNGIVVSGEEKTRKPFPDFFNILLNRYGVQPENALLIDDNLRNIHGAKAVGINGIHFLNASQLKNELQKWNLNI